MRLEPDIERAAISGRGTRPKARLEYTGGAPNRTDRSPWTAAEAVLFAPYLLFTGQAFGDVYWDVCIGLILAVAATAAWRLPNNRGAWLLIVAGRCASYLFSRPVPIEQIAELLRESEIAVQQVVVSA